MKVILKQDVKGVGRRYDIKEVSDGYAVNLLIPKKLAEYASPDAIKSVKGEETRARQGLASARVVAAQTANTVVSKSPQLIEAEKQLKEAQDIATQPLSTVGLSQADMEAQKTQNDNAVALAQERVGAERKKYEQDKFRFVKENTSEERIAYAKANRRKVEMERRMENMAKRIEDEKLASLIPQGGLFVSGKSKANAIRAAAKGKTNKEKFAEVAVAVVKEDVEAGGEESKEEKGGGEGESKPSST